MNSAGRTSLIPAAVLLTCLAGAQQFNAIALQDASPTRFRAPIEAFLESDKASPPPKQAILFIGSSIFRQWENLGKQMAPLPVFNRAFGGSRTGDILYYMDRVVLPYEPKIIVYYCGSNDINAGEKADAIADRFREFVARVKARLPATHVFFVSINRAPQEQERWDVVDDANLRVREYCGTDPTLRYIDVNPVLFDRAGNPRLELYQADRLHLRPQAYTGFAAIIRPVVEAAWGR